jgi:hypothetical protein
MASLKYSPRVSTLFGIVTKEFRVKATRAKTKVAVSYAILEDYEMAYEMATFVLALAAFALALLHSLVTIPNGVLTLWAVFRRRHKISGIIYPSPPPPPLDRSGELELPKDIAKDIKTLARNRVDVDAEAACRQQLLMPRQQQFHQLCTELIQLMMRSQNQHQLCSGQ